LLGNLRGFVCVWVTSGEIPVIPVIYR